MRDSSARSVHLSGDFLPRLAIHCPLVDIFDVTRLHAVTLMGPLTALEKVLLDPVLELIEDAGTQHTLTVSVVPLTYVAMDHDLGNLVRSELRGRAGSMRGLQIHTPGGA